MIRISACLIVRDESDVLERCLSSLSELDEIIVVDTGSHDNSAELARNMGARVKVVSRREPFHFGDAREKALRLARYIWALSVDADEVLLPGGIEALRRAAADGRTHAWEIGFLQRSNADQKEPVHIPLKRFVRADLHHWRFRVHEQLVPNAAWVRTGRLAAQVLEHLPSKQRDQRKGQNFDLLKLAVGESPEYPHLHLYLADEYKTRGDFEKAVEHAEIYIAANVDEGPLWRSEGFLFLGMMLAKLGRKEAALQALERSWEAADNRREPLVHAAELELEDRRLGRALWYLDRALSIPEDRQPEFFLNWPSAWGKMPKEALSQILATITSEMPDFWSRIPKDEAIRLKELAGWKEET